MESELVVEHPMQAEDTRSAVEPTSAPALVGAETPRGGVPARPARSPVDEKRLRRAFDDSFEYVWRFLRRLGVRDALVDDAAQQVFVTFSQKLHDVAFGKERAFLTAIALRVAANQRRSARRSVEVLSDEAMTRAVDEAPNPEQRLDDARRRAWLDDVLATLPLELRTVLILFEIEDVSGPEIALLLEIPVGTVASRLKRARREFQAAARRLEGELSKTGGLP